MPPNLQDDVELRLFNDLKTKYGRLHGDFDLDDQYLNGDFGTNIIPSEWADDGIEVVKLPTLIDAIDSAADHILTDPKIAVPVRPTENDVEKQRQIAENKRLFHELWWARVFEDQGDPLGRGKRPLVKGKLVLKKEIDWSLIPVLPDDPTRQQKRKFRRDLEKIGRSRFIWKLRVIPKKTVYEDLDNPEDPPYVYEAFSIRVAEAIRRFPDLKSKLADRDDLLEEVQYIEYWSKPSGSDRGKYIQWIEEERVHEAINPYSWETPSSTPEAPDWDGYVPYCIGDPGWGEVGEDSDPFDRYVSIIRPLRSGHEAETRQLTAVEAFLRLYIWRIVVTTNMPDVEDGEKALVAKPGAVWDKTENQEIDILNFGDLPLAPFQFLQKVQAEMDRHSRFGALAGSPQRGVDTATEADQNVRNAATKLSGPVNTLRRMVMKINTWVQQDIEKVLEAPVTVYGATTHGPAETTLKPTDINGFYFTQVQLETADEAALNLRNLRSWSTAYQQLPIKAITAMTKAGIGDAQGEFDGRMIEDLERSPQAIQVLLLLMLRLIEQGTGPVGSAFGQALPGLQGAGGGNGSAPPPGDQPQAPNAVAELRRESQQDANDAAPERALF